MAIARIGPRDLHGSAGMSEIEPDDLPLRARRASQDTGEQQHATD
jgi:hypothetical protein